jgi:hypothetical protein
MPDEPPEDLIRYDILTQDAMRSVVKKIITETAKAGLPGDHHFFVSFLTGFPNVRLSTRMRERYPDEMTIVIQHQYWDLKAHENSFEIGLSFDDIPESLSIPFAAIKGFFDPSVQFGLQFDIDDEVDDAEEGASEEDDHEVVVMEPEILKTKKAKSKKKKQSEPVTDKAENDSGAANDKDKNDEGASAEVVSLDAFRKKP